MTHRFSGLIAATFTPMDANGAIALDRVPAIVEHLRTQRVSAMFIGGSTGEGPSMSTAERKHVAEAYVACATNGIKSIVHVGHSSLTDAMALASHAGGLGADAIAAAPPTYYPIPDARTLAASLERIASAAPNLPFFYYHIPRLTNVDIDIVALLDEVKDRVPNFAGVKFSAFEFDVLQRCVVEFGNRFTMLFGSDEMMLQGLSAGAAGAIGSTYNFMGRLYAEIIELYEHGDLVAARRLQAVAARIVHMIIKHPAHPALKATMAIAGVDCGPPRLPLVGLDEAALATLKSDLRTAGFFEWT